MANQPIDVFYDTADILTALILSQHFLLQNSGNRYQMHAELPEKVAMAF